jgi:hypothetical protein
MTTLREKVIKIGAKVVSHARYIIVQLAEASMWMSYTRFTTKIAPANEC